MCIFIKEYRQRKSLLVEFYSFYCLLYFECFFKFAKRSHFVKILTKFHIPLCAMDINKENSYTRKTPVVCIRMKGFKMLKFLPNIFPLKLVIPAYCVLQNGLQLTIFVPSSVSVVQFPVDANGVKKRTFPVNFKHIHYDS